MKTATYLKLTSLVTTLFIGTSTSTVLTRFDAPYLRSKFDFKTDTVQGVNLGGWLLLEPWITPSLFEQSTDASGAAPVDEYTLCAQLGNSSEGVLRNHWNTFITEQDFSDMQNTYQLNTVRIPIGYWAYQRLETDPYVQGQDEYLEKAVQWAEKYRLKVLIDLHGLPGSQNGFDNSGKLGSLEFFSNPDYEEMALNVLQDITQKYLPKYQDTILGIELVNEPFGPSIDINALKDYYNKGYETVRASAPDIPIMPHDAFIGDGSWLNQYSEPNGFTEVIYDLHHYVVFTQDTYNLDFSSIIGIVCNWGTTGASLANPTIVGEWSAALTDCTKYLNGVGNGPTRYETVHGAGTCEGKNNIESYTDEEKEQLIKYIEAQLDAYTYLQNAGWIFWNYKTEGSLEWDFKELVSLGIFPPPPYTSRRYYNQCNYS